MTTYPQLRLAANSAFKSILAAITPIGALFLLSACGSERQTDFATPAAAFSTYKKALEADDLETAWHCYSTSFRTGVYNGDMKAWIRAQNTRDEMWVKDELGREIADEKIINQRIAYLLFDATTLSSPRVSPFFYFLKETDGWKITTHLDSTFHEELESAIDKGEFVLPAD